nr:unnamed protein product [Callosobruchus chinensis]CAH7766156.1 unnamed protein product [Callosobruchus chinensis]
MRYCCCKTWTQSCLYRQK